MPLCTYQHGGGISSPPPVNNAGAIFEKPLAQSEDKFPRLAALALWCAELIYRVMHRIFVALNDRQCSVSGSFQPVVCFPALPPGFPPSPAGFEFPRSECFLRTAYSPPHRAFGLRPIPRTSAVVTASHIAQINHPTSPAAARTYQPWHGRHTADRNDYFPHGEGLPFTRKISQSCLVLIAISNRDARQFIEKWPTGSSAKLAGKNVTH